MANIKKADLEAFEKQQGLEAGDLDYQTRCARMKAIVAGEEWKDPGKKLKITVEEQEVTTSPYYGQTFLITPLMTTDKDRALAYDEFIGYEVNYKEQNAGEQIYGSTEEVERMIGDYEVTGVDYSKPVYAKTTFPKCGTEITYTVGQDLVPVVRGNDGTKGYIWALPPTQVWLDDHTCLMLYGLKQMITEFMPELLPKFAGKPMMSYADGITLCASIPLTKAVLKEYQVEQAKIRKAGLI